MREAVRSELLKLRSGYWLVAMLAFAVWLPLLCRMFTGDGALVPGDETYLVVCPVAASFLGAFHVTRDYHYGSLARAVLSNGRRGTFVGKLVAGAVGGLAAGLVGGLGWTAVTVWVLQSHGAAPDADTAAEIVGCAVASTIAGTFGASIGWVVPNYYLAGAVAMVVPFAVEVPALLTVPEVARFLPNSALAAVIDERVMPGLLPAPAAAAVGLIWTVAAASLGWRLIVRREIR